MHIQPGKPNPPRYPLDGWNACIERFNRTARHEWLDRHQFASIKQAQALVMQWLWQGSTERPDLAIGGVLPRQYLMAP